MRHRLTCPIAAAAMRRERPARQRITGASHALLRTRTRQASGRRWRRIAAVVLAIVLVPPSCPLKYTRVVLLLAGARPVFLRIGRACVVFCGLQGLRASLATAAAAHMRRAFRSRSRLRARHDEIRYAGACQYSAHACPGTHRWRPPSLVADPRRRMPVMPVQDRSRRGGRFRTEPSHMALIGPCV